MKLIGLAAPFNVETTIYTAGGSFREVIRPGAFRQALQRHDQFLLYAHDRANVMSAASNGHLRLRETKAGLEFDADLADTLLSRDTHELIKKLFIGGMSFGFLTLADEWQDDGHGRLPLRSLLDLEFDEISVVAQPAYRTTWVKIGSTQPGDAKRLARAQRFAALARLN